MPDILMIIVAISGVGFGLGVCGVALIALVGRQEDRETLAASRQG